jgi:hypothetical protein
MKYYWKNNQLLKNSRVYMALCFFLQCSLQSLSFVSKDTIIFTGKASIDPLIRTSISDNQFCYLTARSWNLEKRQLRIHTMDLEDFSSKDVIVKVPTVIKVLQCPAFTMSDSFLLLQDDYNLKWFLFKLAQGEYKMIEEIQMPPMTMALYSKVVEPDLFLFTDIYNHHPLDSVYNTSLALYDARQRKFIKTIHPEVPCIALSHFPQNWISQNGKHIAVAEPCGNRIQLYDMNLDLIKIVELPLSKSWVNLPGNSIPFESSPALINPKEFIAKFEPKLSDFSRIQTIHFANDSLLLITVSQPSISGTENLNFVYNTKSRTFPEASKIMISKTGNHINCKDSLTFHIDPYILIRDGLVLSIEEDNFLPDPSISTEANEIRKNQFYETNDPEFIIRISKIDIR